MNITGTNYERQSRVEIRHYLLSLNGTRKPLGRVNVSDKGKTPPKYPD